MNYVYYFENISDKKARRVSPVSHCGKIPIFVKKIKLSKIPFLAGNFKFNVGVDFIIIEFLDIN